MKKIYVSNENGNIHESYAEMMKEGAELYDLGDDTNVVDWKEYYHIEYIDD